MKRSRDIRAERRAKELARHFGHGTPMPDDDAGPAPAQVPDAWWDETPADQRTPVGPLDCAGRPEERSHG